MGEEFVVERAGELREIPKADAAYASEVRAAVRSQARAPRAPW